MESEFEFKRDPDAILRQIAEAEEAEDDTRGKLKIFFGYAAGVGKTYAMLEEAHGVKQKGFDVVAGYIEPHTRAETMALTDGLEKIPPLELEHKGITLKEFNLDAALARKPQIILVDELAHTNAPGSRHRKRYQDIEELLRAGINVFTTVNVQHLEGLNDKIASITHVSVAERIPDYVFDKASSVELIDIEPDDLIERLEAGKIYLPERAGTALKNFFTKKNLAALREVALRRMADRMSRNADVSDPFSRIEVSEDVLVYVTDDPGNVKVIRTAANMAESFHGSLTALVVETAESRKKEQKAASQLKSNIELAEELGAHVVTMHGDDIAFQIAQYSMTAGITQLVIGVSESRRRLLRPSEDLVSRLTRLSHSAVVNVVPVKDYPVQRGRSVSASGLKLTAGDVWKALAAIAVATAAGCLIYEMGLASSVILMLYMLVVMLFAMKADGFFYGIIAALGSMLAYNFFFTMPRFTFNAYGINYPFIFVFMVLTTLVASSLTIRLKRQSEAGARRAYRTEILLESSRKLQATSGVAECFNVTAGQIIKLLNRPVVMYQMAPAGGRLEEPEIFDVPGTFGDGSVRALVSSEEKAVAAWVAANNERAGATTDTLLDARCLYLPIRGKEGVFGVVGLALEKEDEEFGPFEKNMLLMIVDECGQVAEQLASARERADLKLKMEKEELRSNLLRIISHDLRTPLTSISGDADILLSNADRLSDEKKRQMYRDIYEDSTWLISLVENLLAITRVDDGTVKIDSKPEMLDDIIQGALQHVNRKVKSHRVKVELADELLMVSADARLVMQVIVNLVNNAVDYTPEGSTITIVASPVFDKGKRKARISVSDDGPGISDKDKAHIFDMFYNGSSEKQVSGDYRRGLGLGLSLCRSIVRVHGEDIEVRDAEPSGCTFSFTLPIVDASSIESLEDRQDAPKGGSSDNREGDQWT
ncbi:sensor histidine kinase KdpD [Raoultibacter massiliensis]|uniref:histidine kinase n=1 Tax=Raoultibacter massiliensis TaxID=1852371 RepID=A0ABV1JD73_9ACTN